MNVQKFNEKYFTNEPDLANTVENALCEDRELAPNRGIVVPCFDFPRQDLTSNADKFRKLNPSISLAEKKNACDRENDLKCVGIPVEVTMPETRIPSFEKMEIRILESPFNRMNSVIIYVPSVKSPIQVMKAAFVTLYKLFQSRAPAITFCPHQKNLRFKGSFTEGFSTCAFAAEAWAVNKSASVREYIIELRQTSKSGRRTFEDFKRLVAVALKDGGFATTYANGREIHSLQTHDSDLGELAMPGWSRNENNMCPVTLQENDVTNMAATIAERTYPQCVESIELLARFSVASEDNRELLRADSKLAEAIHDELRNGFHASTCHNALKLILHGAVDGCDMLPAVARSLQVHSGCKRSGYKIPRSRAIECTALGVMERLTCEKQRCYQVEALRKIEDELRGTVRSDVFRRLQDIRSRQGLVC